MLRFYLKTFEKLTHRSFCKSTNSILTMEDMINDAKNIYQSSVQAVQPEALIHGSIRKESNKLEIQGVNFTLHKNVYIVGFGKAVLGMAASLVDLLNDHIISGILSVPSGTRNEVLCQKLISLRIEVFEGAKDNIPDKESLLAANKISELVSSLDEHSLLFVLISGGGSALLPSPRFPLTLEEKQKVIKILASRGATIEEINIIRKKLSLLKGGGLAQLAKPAKVVSLILSDIIGDPIEFIASGPTVKNSDDLDLPLSIVEKYKIKDIIPSSALQLLEKNLMQSNIEEQSFDFVNNFIIGNNKIALNAAAEKATELQYKPVIMTNNLSGLATDVGQKIIQLLDAAFLDDSNTIFKICNELNIEREKCALLRQKIKKIEDNMGLCLLFGGETTVEVKGSGTGGRNQELALTASLELYYRKLKDVVLLSAGTDGIDGPTDAAGAIATPFIIDTASKEGIEAKDFLYNNDSYGFYNLVHKGSWHVKIGHTGTNVMDVIVVLTKKL